KVMDFGIARALADSHSVTQTAAVIGTAQYLSPEQAKGDPVDARSDVYALGCVLYEILTGDPPFVGDSPVAVAYQHVREDPVPPSARNPEISPELDAVVLKALSKNPDNRYQSAAEMRADLVRVHSGERPEAPRVFTDAERTSFLAAPAPPRDRDATENLPRAQSHYVEPPKDDRTGSVTRWVVAVAVLAVLTVLVTLAINFFGGETREVQVPDVTGQSADDAIVVLQNAGFRTRTQNEPNSDVSPDRVIGTDPEAAASVAAGEEITIRVSTGPEQRSLPDCKGMSYEECVTNLRDAGFERFNRSPSVSAPEDRDKVLSTVPPANQTSAITNQITVVVGTGPGSKVVPDCASLNADDCRALLTQTGFSNTLQVDVDSTRPIGTVLGTNPAAGQNVPVTDVIQIQVSRGNQFTMPNLRGQFWVDAEPLLRSLGWTGGLVKLPNAQNSGIPTNGVVTQDPAAGEALTKDASISLSFAQ
ncbi:MAG: pknB 1, partial [Mycobacterium sp.]|nr:pknB 1 [Mycobacterium sp.]